MIIQALEWRNRFVELGTVPIVCYFIISFQSAAESKLASQICQKQAELSASLKMQEMWKVYQLELSIVCVLVTMETQGINVDMAEFSSLDRIMLVSRLAFVFSISITVPMLKCKKSGDRPLIFCRKVEALKHAL